MSLSEDMVRLTEAMREAQASRVAAVGAMHQAVDKQLADLQTAHHEMATAQREELQQFATTLRRNVSTLIHDLDAERAALNADQRRRLDAFTHDLRHDMADFLHERAAERRSAGTSQRQHLDAYMSTLRERTGCFLADAHTARMAIHADHSSAQQAWHQFNTEMRQRRTGQPVPPADAEQSGEFNTAAQQRRPGKRQQKAPQE